MNNLKGAAWMISAMAMFATVDTFIKLASATIALGHIMLVMGLAGLAVFSFAARRKGIRALPLAVFKGAALGRTMADALAASLAVFAISQVDLTLFTTVTQANPLLVTLGAALFLGEPVGWRRWSAIAVGLIGVLILLRPTGGSYDFAFLLVVFCVIAQAAREILTRAVPHTVDSVQLSSASFLALAGLGFLIAILQGSGPFRPAGTQWHYLVLGIIAIIPAVYSMIASMRIGEVGFVAPFRYTRIVFGLGLGVLVFQEQVDGFTLLGAAIVTGSGLYSFWREARVRRASLSTPEAL